MFENKQIPPLENELPSAYADRMGILYSQRVKLQHKKTRGQFFTPPEIARFMGSLACSTKDKIKILDPGCGTGILTCALVESLVERNRNLEQIELVAYETDDELITFSSESLNYLSKWLLSRGIKFKSVLTVSDFILENKETLIRQSPQVEHFDYVISNPPYFKLSKEDQRAIIGRRIVSGQPNIYSVFLAVASKLLVSDGELIFITPRSFASGDYFRAFREFFFANATIKHIHLFHSRKEAFSRENILQETMIMVATPKQKKDEEARVVISSSYGMKDLCKRKTREYKHEEIIDLNSKEKILHIPVNEYEEKVINLFKSWDGNLHQYDIKISTGPVVAFRTKKYIYETNQVNKILLTSLFWLHNVRKMKIEWPIFRENKSQYIKIGRETQSILIPNKNYIFLRRFSSKDDKSRLIASPYFFDFTQENYIGVENKLNYIYRSNGHLDRDEVLGLSALLNSNLFDTYFRTFNGNVNVSATELRAMPLPPLEVIKNIGRDILIRNNFSESHINELVEEYLEMDAVSI